MSLGIRIALIVCALALFTFVMRNIRKSKLRIQDSLFWFMLSAVILVIAVFPGIATACSRFFQFQAPVNFVFLAFIAILLVKSFTMSIRSSQLETKLEELTQQMALRQKEEQPGDSISSPETQSTASDPDQAVEAEANENRTEQ